MAIQKGFNIINSSNKAIILASAISLLAAFPLYSASIEEFKTEEYYGSGGLDLINAAEAYSKGYTGKGITIGINDTPVNLEHESFSSKTGSKYIGSLELNGIDWNEYAHGTHVGGIAVGAKNEKGMHGVAFDADTVYTCFNTKDFDFPKFDSYSEIKCINNSWGRGISVDDYYPSEDIEDGIISEKGIDKFVTQLKNNGEYGLYPPIFEAVSKDKLLIFSNTNQGQHETDLLEFMNWLNGKSVNNLISVTAALNSFGDKKHLERNSDGSITGDYLVAPFTNLAKYFEDNIVSAPGWNIYSSNAADKNDYILLSGTSMSAPFVTGGAALVQQAFPYMNSKQIGDVLLSTANSNIKIENPFCVTCYSFITGYDDKEMPIYDYKVKVFYFDEKKDRSDAQIKNDILLFLSDIQNEGDIAEKIIPRIEGALNKNWIEVYYQTPIQEFVGQGILDVGKAVSGPSALNARRLEKENISSKYLTDGQKTVMYEIDTQGYDSVWSNDIKEILVGKLADDSIEEDLRERYNYYNVNWLSNDKADKWAKTLTKAYVEEFNDRVDKSGLEGLHVGLLKSGKGVLKLEGNNSYKGATVVSDGAIAVNGSVAGDAYSENDGIIMGKGKISGTLYNNNIAIAGDNGEGNLTMGCLESKGKLVSALNSGENTKFVVDGKANIDGSTVVVAGLLPGESCTVLKADSITGELANRQDNTTGTTAFLKEYAKIENNEVKYVYDLSPNFDGVTAKQIKTFDAIKRMYFKLMSEYEGEPGPASSRGSICRAATTQQQMAQILTFINLPAAQAGPALNAVTLNAAAQSMTLVQRNSMTGDILSSHFGDRFTHKTRPQSYAAGETGDEATSTPRCSPSLAGGAAERSEAEGVLNEETPRPLSSAKADTSATRSHPVARLHAAILGGSPTYVGADHNCNDRGAWFKFAYNKGEMRDGARYHGRSGIIGYDLKLTDNKSYGLFFGHGNNTLDGFDDAWAKNKIEENKFGFYASRKNEKASGYLYLDYGKVDNELRRNLTNLGLSTNVKYKGNLFEIGGEYKLTPKNQKNKSWKVYPYINLQFSRYKQDGFHEKDGGIYNHVVDGKTNNYAAGQLGLEFNFSNEKENYVLRLAGKTAFSGYEPKLTYSFEGDMGNRYELDDEQDKKHLLVSFKGERKISTNSLLSADFTMLRGSHDRDMKASLAFWKKF